MKSRLDGPADGYDLDWRILKSTCLYLSVTFYVQYFAGDKDDITIGGMSAGGQSVHAHLVMPSR